MLLYDVNSAKNGSVPSWKYDIFNLDNTEKEYISEFRFEEADIFFCRIFFKYLTE